MPGRQRLGAATGPRSSPTTRAGSSSAITIVGVGLFFFIWFLGQPAERARGRRGRPGRLASIAFGGGIVGVVTLLIALTAPRRRPSARPRSTRTVTRALNDFGRRCGAPAAAGFTALFAATAIAGYRHGALPAPVAGFSALAAITQPLASASRSPTAASSPPTASSGLVHPGDHVLRSRSSPRASRCAAPAGARAAGALSRSRRSRRASCAGPARGRPGARRRSAAAGRAGRRGASRPCGRCSPPSACRRGR